MKIILLTEFTMRRLIVRMTPRKHTFLRKLVDVIPKITCLCSTTWSLILWVKIQYYLFIFKRAKRYGFSILIPAGEYGRLIANL